MGGVIGHFYDTNRSRPLIMRDIFSSADVLATNSTAGGIIGQIEKATVDLRNLHASGNVTVGDAGQQNTYGWAGGLIGSAYFLEGEIENVSASGDVLATGDTGSDFKHMGGLFGELIGYEYLDQPQALRVTNASSVATSRLVIMALVKALVVWSALCKTPFCKTPLSQKVWL